MPATAPKRKQKPGRKEDPGSYRAAADAAGVSPTHAFLVLNGNREAADLTISKFRSWASNCQRLGIRGRAVDLALDL